MLIDIKYDFCVFFEDNNISIKEDRGQLMHDSKARAISFSLELKKVSDSPLGLKGKALQLGVSIARRIAGI